MGNKKSLMNEDEVTIITEKDPKTCNVILLGTGYSGKSTLFFQLSKFNEKSGKKEEFIKNTKPLVYINTLLITVQVAEDVLDHGGFADSTSEKAWKDLKDCFEGGFEKVPTNITLFAAEPLKFIGKLKLSDFIQKLKDLWEDEKMKDYLTKQKNNKKNIQYYEGVEHFVSKESLERFSNPNYYPSEEDVLRCRRKTTGIHSQTIPTSHVTYEVQDVGGQRNERKKWIQVLKNADIIVYLVNLADFDEQLYEDNDENRMKESIETFEQSLSADYIQEKPVFIFFNKLDLLKEKLKDSEKLNILKKIFPDYQGEDDVEKAEKFIKEKFCNLWKNDPSNLHVLSGQIVLEKDVKNVFESVKIITDQLEKKGNLRKSKVIV